MSSAGQCLVTEPSASTRVGTLLRWGLSSCHMLLLDRRQVSFYVQVAVWGRQLRRWVQYNRHIFILFHTHGQPMVESYVLV